MGQRAVIWRTSWITSLFGLTEPLFVPEYWNPPTLFDLAQRTGFDLESLVFCFGIGEVGAVLYNVLTGRELVERVWNLQALSGIVLTGIPLEELLFGFTFGLYWTGVYEHLGWSRAEAPASTDGGTACSPRT